MTRGRPKEHGHSADGKLSPAYRSWRSMRQRCLDPMHKAYKDYGGRGITFCARWNYFENFYADMGDRPPGMSLDRYPDVDGNYEPSNCRWATSMQQAHNKR